MELMSVVVITPIAPEIIPSHSHFSYLQAMSMHHTHLIMATNRTFSRLVVTQPTSTLKQAPSKSGSQLKTANQGLSMHLNGFTLKVRWD